MSAMPMVLLRLSEAAFTPIKRPQRCPNCGSQILQKWGKSSRVVQDIDPHIIEVSRFRCEECCSTFRWYPPGVSRSTWTRQIRSVAAILFAMGLSSREIMNILSKAGIHISHSMVWREGRELLERMNGGEEIRNSIHFAIHRDYL